MVISMKKTINKYQFIIFVYFLIYICLCFMASKSTNDVYAIVVNILLLLLIIFNLKYVILNYSKFKLTKIYNKNLDEIDIHPLELYLINSVWYHKKQSIGSKQIQGAVLYEIEKGNLILEDDKINISPKVNLDKVPEYTLLTFSLALLKKTDARKIAKYKKTIFLNQQKKGISLKKMNNNIKQNCADLDLYYKLTDEIKEKYFDNIESYNTVYLTVASWLTIFVTAVLVYFSFVKPTILNFFLPAGFATLLLATLTSKYRERVTIKPGFHDKICDTLNYISYLKRKDKSKINDIYAYTLNKPCKEIGSIFNR